jgi:hypothetical protein
LLPYTGKDLPLGIKVMFNCNPAWKDLKIGEVMRLLEQNGVDHANPNELKRRIQGFLKRLKQTAATSDDGIDEGVSNKSWGRVMQVCEDFSKEKVYQQLSNDDRRRDCSPLDCSCVAVPCDRFTY